MRTADEYKESLKKMRPNVYKFGELIDDVTSHPSTKRTVAGHARIFEMSHKDETRDMVTKESSLDNGPVSRYLTLVRCADDQIDNSKMKRLLFQTTGTCTGGRCVGWTALNSMWATTYDIDQEHGTDYHKRIRAWLDDAQKRDISVAGALTDPKGDRSKRPAEQSDPDSYLRVVETRDDGIVVRGAKVQICGIAAANEVFVLPGTAFKEDESQYAVSFVIPRDTEGLTCVETRHPSDMRDMEDGFDNPVEKGGITQSYLLFDDVFIPNERVLMNGETRFTLNAVMNFVMMYRSAIGGCVAGQGDLMVGASGLMARANGLEEKKFADKLIEMQINNETTFAMGVAAAAMGKSHPSGIWICDPLLANVNKVYVGRLPYETKRMAQDIGGGICETGCMPSCQDMDNPEYGELIKKYLAAGCSGEERAKVARLIEWLTLGAGVPGCMHGGGSPDGAKLLVRLNMDIKGKMQLARDLIGIKEV